MVPHDCILAVDIGTSATKAVLFTTDLQQIAIARKPHPIHAPSSGWSEQGPEVIFQAVVEAIREITQALPEGTHLRAVSLSSQLYSVLATSADGRPLTNSLTGSDTRSARIAQHIRQRPDAQGIYQRTGCPLDAIYPLAKIRWLQEHHRLPADAKFVSIKEYVLHRLLGRFVVDWSVASATGLLDIRQRRWDDAALSLAGITPAHLSELRPPRHTFTDWKAEILDVTGLPPRTPLVIGGGDGPLASLGVGAFRSDILAVNVGTSAAARATISEARVDPLGRLWTYVVDEDLWVIGGVTSSGGGVYEWFLKNFLAESHSSIDSEASPRLEAERIAASIPPGADGLVFVPYLGGEQCPDWLPYVRGGFFGIDFRHTRAHFARAVLEGITYSIYRITDSVRSVLDEAPLEIRVTGGLASSPLWQQMAADVFGVSIVVPKSVEGSARGAAMLALLALGLRSDLEDLADLPLASQRIDPREDVHAGYQKHYQDFLRILNSASNWPISQE